MAHTHARPEATACMAVPGHSTPESARKDWSASEARRQLLAWAGIEGQMSAATPAQRAKFKRGFAYVAGEGETMADHKLPHHYVEGGALVFCARGVMSAAGAVQGARGGVELPPADVAAVKAHLARHYKAMDMDPPWAAESRAREAGGHVVRAAALAAADAPRQKLYYILNRADEPDSYGYAMDAAEVERAADRFMVECVRPWSSSVGLNHMCADCPHDFAAHHLGADAVPCRMDNCLCSQYRAFMPEPLRLVENFIAGADIAEWHGAQLAEPFKRGDHVIAVRVEHPALFALLAAKSSVSWEGFSEIEVPAA